MNISKTNDDSHDFFTLQINLDSSLEVSVIHFSGPRYIQFFEMD